MLTQSDLKNIKELIEPVNTKVGDLDKKVTSLEKDIKTIKKDASQTRKDVKVLIAYFDREYVELRKRIDKIEEHLGLTSN